GRVAVQVGFTRPAAVKYAQLGQARVAVQVGFTRPAAVKYANPSKPKHRKSPDNEPGYAIFCSVQQALDWLANERHSGAAVAAYCLPPTPSFRLSKPPAANALDKRCSPKLFGRQNSQSF